MSLGSVSHDAYDPPLFSRPIVRPIVPTGLFSPHLDFRHGSITMVPFITSIRVPFIPSITIPFVHHPTVPVTPRYTTPKAHGFKKQTGNAYLGSRGRNPTCRGDILVPDPYDKGTMALQPTLRTQQEYEPVSISKGHCTPSVCSPRYLSGRLSQGYTRNLPSTELPVSFPEFPLVVYSGEMERLSATDSAMDATGFATTPVTHFATAILDPSSLEVGQSRESVHGSSSFPEPSCAGAPNTACGSK
jgi:hypothetical protein